MNLSSWKDNIVSVIDKIGDLDFQQAVWLNGFYWHRVLSFGEAVNILEDYYFYDKVQNKSLTFENEELQLLLVSFSVSLLSYEEPNDVEKMLRDKKWLEIVEKAQKICFNSHLLILKD